MSRRPLKAQLQAELGAAADADQQEAIRAAFSAREKAIEHDIDHKPMDVHMCLDVAYNVSACSLPAPSKFCMCAHSHTGCFASQFLSK